MKILFVSYFVFWGIVLAGVGAEKVNETLDPNLLGEFIRQYCATMKKSRVIFYGDLSTGWWSSGLSGRWRHLGRYLARSGISVSIIDLAYHSHQKLPPLAVPPGGSATLMTAMYDGSSTAVGTLLKKSSDLRMFRSRFNWLVLTPEDKQNDLEELFQQMGIYADSNVRYGVIQGSQVVKVWEVYHVALDKPLRITYFGDWSPVIADNSTSLISQNPFINKNLKQVTKKWRFSPVPLPYKYIKRANLEGMHLKAITVGVREYNANFHRNSKGVLEVTGGLFGEVFTTFEDSINFTYTLKYIPGYSYGNIKDLGNNWTGVVGHLATKRADIALCGISQSQWRLSVIDLTAPLLFQSSRLFVNGSPSPYQFDLYLRPFTRRVWTALCIWFFLMTSFQKILRLTHCYLKTGQQECVQPPIRLNKRKKRKINSNLKGFVQNAMDRGSFLEESVSTRLLLLSGSILFTVASTGYSAKLTSFHAIHKFIPEIENIKDLAKSPDWNMGILNGSWDRWLMQNSPLNSSMGILWAERIKKQPSNIFKYPQEGLLKVSQTQRYAYLGDNLECRLILAGIKVGAIEDELQENQGEVFKISADNKGEEILPPSVACKVAELPRDVVKIGSSFGLQKYSPIKDIFNYNLIKLWSTGVLQNLRKKYLETPQKLCNAQLVFQPASIGDTFFSLILFGGGVLFSLFTCVAETMIDKIHMHMRSHKTIKKRKYHKVISYAE